MSDNYMKNIMATVLNLPVWQGVITDANLSVDVQARHNIQKGMAKVRKTLFDRKANPEYAALRNAQSTLRAAHLGMTVPTTVDGMRGLPTAKYLDHKEIITTGIQKVEDCAEKFAAVFPRIIQQAKLELGDAFDLADYPPQSEIAGRFKPRIQYLPMPVAKYFEAEGPGVDQDAIREEITKQFRDSLGSGIVKDLYGKLRTVLTDVQKQLAQANCRLSDRSTAAMTRVFESVQSLDPATWAKEEATDHRLGKLTSALTHEVSKWDTKAINKGGQAKTLAQQEIATALTEINRKLSSLNATTKPVEENTMPATKTDAELFQEFLAWKQSQKGTITISEDGLAKTWVAAPTEEDDDISIEGDEEDEIVLEDDEDEIVIEDEDDEVEVEEESVYDTVPTPVIEQESKLSVDDVLKALGLKA